MRNLFASLCVCGLLSMAGCLELAQTVTLNPDGSGKMLVNMTAPSEMPMMGGGGKKPDPAAVAKQFAQQQIAQSRGVDAWSDVAFDVKDGKVHFKGTAYFPDVCKVKVGMGEEGGTLWTREGNTIVMQMKQKEQPGKAPGKQLSDEEAKKQLEQAKQQWNQSKPMMQMFLGTLKMEQTYILPGKVTEAKGFMKTDKGVQIAIDGKKVMEVMDAVMKDDAAMLAAIKSGQDPMKDQELMMEKMFGVKGAMMAKMEDATKPLFEYKVEMEKAKANEAEMFKKVGIDK